MSAGGLDWPGLMRVGMRGLGLRPWEFWRLTPAELSLMLGHGGAEAPLSRARLEALSAQFPDHPPASALAGKSLDAQEISERNER